MSPGKDGSRAARADERDQDRPPRARTLIAGLVGFCAAALAGLGFVAGASAVAVGLAVLGGCVTVVLCHVAGAEVLDGQYRRTLHLVRRRNVSMLGWSALVSSARTSATGFAHSARPELQRLYAVRLAEKHGVSLLTEPDKAAALIGPELWPWVDPSRPAPLPAPPRAPHHALDRRSGSGAPPPDAVLIALVDRLEQL